MVKFREEAFFTIKNYKISNLKLKKFLNNFTYLPKLMTILKYKYGDIIGIR